VEDLEAGSQIISIGYIGAVNCVGAIRAVAAHSNGKGSDEDRAQRLRFLNGAPHPIPLVIAYRSKNPTSSG
jgi:hypothetical protein